MIYKSNMKIDLVLQSLRFGLGVIVAGALLSACVEKRPTDEIYDANGHYVPPPLQASTCEIARKTPPEGLKTFWLGLATIPETPPAYFNGNDYLISLPIGYFEGKGGAQMAERIGRSDGAIMVSARYPDFAPYGTRLSQLERYTPNQLDHLSADKDGSSKVTMVWGGLSNPDIYSGDFMLPENRDYAFKSWFKTDPYDASKNPENYDDVEVKRSPFGEGLHELDPDMKFGRAPHGSRHFFTYNKDGRAVEYIRCSLYNHDYKKVLGRDEIMSRCEHDFNHRGLKMSINYPARLLDNWVEIRHKATDLLDCAVIEVAPRYEKALPHRKESR